MNLDDLREKDEQFVIHTYPRNPVAFVRGKGARLWDTEGKEYLDFLAGIAVVGLGHSHPRLVETLRRQAATLVHTSNLYYIPPQADLAERLSLLSGGMKSFFCNSGAEANEAAIKLARKHQKLSGHENRIEIITAEGSFHGRTLAAITATAQPRYHKGFEPLPAGFRYVPFNDLEAMEAAVGGTTCAVMVEPIQGESGVRVADEAYLKGLRDLCNASGALLILDEVQTGIGRTGTMFAHEQYGIEPDIMTLAKSLAGGVPMGAMLASPEVASSFSPGDHASTFGGNYLACACALTVLDVIEEERLLENTVHTGEYLTSHLQDIAAEFNCKEVRGRGLLLALELNTADAKALAARCLEKGLIVNAIGDTVLRFAPPLIVQPCEVDSAMEILKESFAWPS